MRGGTAAACFLTHVHNCGAKLYSCSIPDALSIIYYDILHMVPCGPLCCALICTCKYSPLRSTLPCSHMYSYLQSLTAHSAVLSHVLVPTVPCSPLCCALTCTHTYSPLQSTLPSLAVHSAVLSCVLKLHRRQSTYVTHQLRDLYSLILLGTMEQ
jgi:hypothetical protein